MNKELFAGLNARANPAVPEIRRSESPGWQLESAQMG